MAAARVLLAVPAPQRQFVARAILAEAHLADVQRINTGRLHPQFGNGTVLSAALTRPCAEPKSPGDIDYLRCIAAVLAVVLEQDSVPDP